MNPDPALISDPMFVLLAWAGGICVAAAFVTLRGIVGVGFTWLASAVGVLIAIWPALDEGSLSIWVGVGAVALAGVIVSVNRLISGVALVVAAGLFVLAAAEMAGLPLALSATAALGGVTGEMLLGHWYLVDPTLARWVLRVLAMVGIAGAILDGAVLAITVGLPDDAFLVAVFWVLVLTTAGLMTAVIGALRYPAYSGVMAATGLSYLAVLTGLAAVFFGRVLASGTGPFS